MADWVFHTDEAALRTHSALPGVRSGEVEFADALEKVNPDVALIRGIANAAKHLKLRSRRPVPHAPIDAANTFVTSTGYGQGAYGAGPYGGGPRVMLEGNGTNLVFADIARSVHGMWQTLKAQHGW